MQKAAKGNTEAKVNTRGEWGLCKGQHAEGSRNEQRAACRRQQKKQRAACKRQRWNDLKGFDDMCAHEGLLGVPSGLESVVLAGLPLLVLSLLEGGHQALHPLMHPHVCPLPP